jgi:two-component system, OmpR family, phosphate regulon response regulator PhoB
MSHRILCVEDAIEYQILIGKALTGYELIFCSSIAATRKVLSESHASFDFVLLDVSLPDGSGLEFLGELRDNPSLSELPVFILSVDDAILSKVAAFGIGVDDYICKPFNPLELKSRIEARLKKAEQFHSKRRIIGNLVLDQSRMQASFQDGAQQKIDMTPIEFKILFLLSRRPEVIYTRQQIIDEVWGHLTHITDRTVDAHISHVRKKLESSKVSIETVLGVGYKLKVQKNG